MSTVIDRWIADMSRALPGHTPAQKAAIAAELRDHLNTRLAQGYTADELLRGFGDPAVFARQFRDDGSCQSILTRQQWLAGIAGLVSVTGRSITAAFALVVAGVCGLLAFAVLRLAAETSGLASRLLAPLLPDPGAWTLPVAILMLLCLWVAARLSLKLAVTSLRLDPAQ
jgi:uncharacterized membrane protein